ncbi:MAG: AAA family ATPase [Candidatus Riflebacteria bacterium]|nr:AAA family ATPase [Candidatus Riflebacteria bacterium]
MNTPTGIIALIFTDVEGSTALWEQIPDAMRESLRLHDECLRRLLVTHHGYEVKTEGDAFMVSFSNPGDAVKWCLAVQKRLLEETWPKALLANPLASEILADDGTLLHRGLRVRMGGHLGAPDCRPDPVTGRMDYFGPVVNRSARVGSAGHGGQILFSTTLWEMACRLVDLASVTVEDLGEHGMKGLLQPERLVQVQPLALSHRRFPPLKTQNPKRTNLRAVETPLIGRKKELETLEKALGGSRLVTVVAPGGTGKTRLVLEFGYRLFERDLAPKGGVWFCDLTNARNPSEVIQAVAAILGVSLTQGHTFDHTVETIARTLAGHGPLLLLLDNFEQVLSAAPLTLGRWLPAAPELRILVTSREPLGLAGEVRLELDPLDIEAGVELFSARAAAAKPGFAVDDSNRGDVRALVADLDGLPLALELAAARVRLLSIDNLRRRLEKSLDVLSSRRQDLSPRQRTLRGTMDWSWDLLNEFERELLSQVSVFHGGFFLEEAEAVVILPDIDGAPPILDLLESISDKSLLRIQDHPNFPGETWFRLLATIREYAAEKLETRSNVADIRLRHARHFTGFGEHLVGTDLDRVRLRADGVARLEASRENLEAAFDFLCESDPDGAAKLALSLGPLLDLRGPAIHHKTVLDRALELAHEGPEKADLLRDRAKRSFLWNRYDDALTDCREALNRSAGNPVLEGEVLAIRGSILDIQGDLDKALADLHRAMELAVKANSLPLKCRVMGALGGLYLTRCFWVNAREHLEKAVSYCRELRNHRLEALYILMLGFVAWEQGNEETALSCYDTALAYHREAGSRFGEAMTLQWMGELKLATGNLLLAREYSEAAMALAREYDAPQIENGCRFNLAVIAMEEGKNELAGLLFDEAIDRAKKNQDPFTEGALLFYRATLQALNGAVTAAEETFRQARELVPLSFQESQGTNLWDVALDLGHFSNALESGDAHNCHSRLREARRRLAKAVEPEASDPLTADLEAGEQRIIGNKRASMRYLRKCLEAAEAKFEK